MLCCRCSPGLTLRGLQVQLRVRDLLPGGTGLLHRLPEVLQAGHAAVLRGQTAHGRHHRRPAGVRKIQRRGFQVSPGEAAAVEPSNGVCAAVRNLKQYIKKMLL